MIKQATKRPATAGKLRDEATKAVRRGFTLLEIVVVISLILFLVGLTLTVGVTVIERSEITQTENTMRLLDMALQEWEIAADRKLSWGRDGLAPDGSPSPAAVYDLQGNPAILYGPSLTDAAGKKCPTFRVRTTTSSRTESPGRT